MKNRSAALRILARLLALVLFAMGTATSPAFAQFIPYYGKNKVKYDNFSWRIYKSPHFEVYYYPEFEQHLARVVSYAESAYQKVSADLKHEISFPIPMILYKTHSEFEQTNLFPAILPEGILAFAEPTRDRMVLPIDEPPDKLQGLITHELTHIFEFDLVPRGLVQRQVPLWVDEGLADFERGTWDPLDLMTMRDAAVTDQIPKLSRLEQAQDFTNPRVVYNLGHSAFEFIEARYGKEGIRQFLYTLRKSVVGGGVEDIYQQAFRIKPNEFDDAFDKWLKERFKPFRDKQRPSDYGQDLSPDSEKTPYTQVFAFSPSPSGELVAAITGNRSEGEADVVLLSAKDRAVIRNLTSGYTGQFENISINENFVAGRSVAFDPKGDSVAFFARTGKRRSLFLLSVLSGKILKRVPLDLDQAQSPCLLPDGRRVLFSALKEGVSDIYVLDLESGEYKNLTQDAFADADPQVSPDGNVVVYSRHISGQDKIYSFPLANPSRKTALTFGTHDDVAPTFSADGNIVYYSSNEDDEIFNIRSLDLRTGVIRQYTDALGGSMAPAPFTGKGVDRIGFISYFKGEYRLQSIELGDPQKEVEQEIQVASDDIIDFQPDVVHQVVSENKRRKRLFEKLFLEGRPPINVGVTSGGDFFGGSQVALADVLGDQNFLFTALSQREFRSYEGTYINLAKRLHYGISGFDTTQFFYASPYDLQQGLGFSRQGAFATQRVTGGSVIAQYPFDMYRRLEVSAGYIKLSEQFENVEAQFQAEQQAAALGTQIFLNNGSLAPLSVNLVQETTRFREFGPLSGSTFSLGFTVAPSIGGSLSRHTFDVDARKYLRLTSGMLLAARFRGFKSGGTNPDYFYFGGNMELRGYPYLSIAGNQGFFANLELRIPIIDVMKTPLGILGPVRGTIYAGLGGAKFRGDAAYQMGTSDPGVSYVNYPGADVCAAQVNADCFGEAVSGYHLVDGRASYGAGLQFFFLGYPLHFDWSKLTDLKVSSRGAKFSFWIGFDF